MLMDWPALALSIRPVPVLKVTFAPVIV